MTAAADVYALGVIAYEMLTGGRPFDAENQATLITQTLDRDSRFVPRLRRSGLPAAIDAAVMKCAVKRSAIDGRR